MTVNVLLTCFGKREDLTSCVTCYVISNHTSFCYIVDSANEMHLRVIAQPCAGVPKTLQNVARLHIVVFYNKSPFNTQVLFLTGCVADFKTRTVISNRVFGDLQHSSVRTCALATLCITTLSARVGEVCSIKALFILRRLAVVTLATRIPH